MRPNYVFSPFAADRIIKVLRGYGIRLSTANKLKLVNFLIRDPDAAKSVDVESEKFRNESDATLDSALAAMFLEHLSYEIQMDSCVL